MLARRPVELVASVDRAEADGPDTGRGNESTPAGLGLSGELEVIEYPVVQATLMRVTIHLVSREDFWPFALATRAPRRAATGESLGVV